VRDGELPQSEPMAGEGGAALYADNAMSSALRQSAAGGDVADLLAAHLQRAKPGQYVAIMAYLQRTEEHDRLLARLRVAVRDTTHAATTVGYGPRFLHSTGQLHKGGPATGVFLQITGEDETDLDIPGAPGYTFSILKQAQAIGDLQALQSRKRPVVRLHVEDDVTANLRRIVDAVEAKLGNRAAVD